MASTPIAPRTVATSEGLITYRHAAPPAPGQQSPVVLLHGLGGTSVVWSRNILALAERRPAYAIDLWSAPPADSAPRATPQAGVDFLRAFLEAIEVDSAHVVGSSLGGLIAGHFAIDDPTRVRSLTLVGSAGLGREIAWGQRLLTLPRVGEFFFKPTEKRARRMLKLLIKRGDIPEDIVQALYEDSLTPGVLTQMLAALRSGVSLRGVKPSIQFLERLRQVHLPVLVAGGERDPLFPQSHLHRAAAALPDAQLRIFTGCGHWPYFEDSAAFNQSLSAFFDSVESRPTA